MGTSKHRAAVTIDRPREEVERRWQEHAGDVSGTVTFKEAPGDRGTEVHVEVEGPRGGVVGEAVQKVTGSDPLAKAKDELRHFKQLVETGVIARSEAFPEGETLEKKFKHEPAQPLEEAGTR